MHFKMRFKSSFPSVAAFGYFFSNNLLVFTFIFRLEKSRNLIDLSTNICKEQAQTIASLETKLKIGFENEHLLRDTLLQNDELKLNLSKINDEIKLKEEKYFNFLKFY